MHSAQSPPILNTTPADPRESPWYPYDNGAGGFDANIAMILIFLFCALVCGLALHAVIRFFLRRSDPLPSSSAATTTTTTATTLPVDHKLIAADSVALPAAPSLVYSAGMKLAGAAAECAICLSEFVSGEGVTVLPRCKHGFHVKCIEGWLSSHSSCPTCRSSCLAMSPDKTAAAVGPETNVDIESQLEQPIEQHQHQQRSERE